MIAADARSKPSKRERRATERKARERFKHARKAEHGYARHLRKIAKTVGDVVNVYVERGWVHEKLAEMTASLKAYSAVLEPWARAVASRMLAEVARRDERAWREATGHLGRGIRSEIQNADVGAATRELLQLQVGLIKSLPVKAAERVQALALKAVETGDRSGEIVREIKRTGYVTQSRAELIARTETSRAQTTFTMARSLALGSEGYVWRTAKDANVRDSHRKMEGKFVRWSQPPTLDKMTGHAGCLPECRCYPEVVFRD